tara:strand:- start:1466 stop:1696 length:231 start_codon:yes stop_codon:yes gene_type:complete
MNKSELKKLSKIELEKLGRTKGVELDRRFNKKTLIEQLTGLFTKEPTVTTPVESAKPVKAISSPRRFRVNAGKSNA